jgi:hypothetical protein
VHLQEHGPRKRNTEVNLHQLVQCSDRKGPKAEMLDASAAEGAGELARFHLLGRDPNGGEHADRLPRQTPASELEHTRGGSVEPLDVVDGEEHTPGVGKDAQAAEEGGCDCPIVERNAVRLLEQERDLERPALRRRELR